MELIFNSPIVARVQSRIDPAGITVAALFFSPKSVMALSVALIYFVGVLVISDGVHHAMSPPQ